MKGRDIADALAVNSLAEFAYQPALVYGETTKIVRVRGLSADIPGAWTFKESTHPTLGHWCKSELGGDIVYSRQLITVEDAERELKARQEANAQHYADNRKADQVIADLTRLGVACRRFAGGVHVQDVPALGRLLARVP